MCDPSMLWQDKKNNLKDRTARKTMQPVFANFRLQFDPQRETKNGKAQWSIVNFWIALSYF